MSSAWSIFIIVGTLGSLALTLWLLLSNRNKPATGEAMEHVYDGIGEVDNPLPVWWVGMFIFTIIFALGYLFYYPGLGNIEGAGEWSSAKEWQYRVDQHEERFAPLFVELASKEVGELIADPKAMQIGRRLFLNNCSTCHGMSAQGSPGFPNLTDGEWLWGNSFENIKTTILNGRKGVMPPWGQVLSDTQVTDLLGFMNALPSQDMTALADHPGNASYSSLCIACHAANGKGNPALGAPDLTNDIWLYGGDEAALRESIVKGRAGDMPGHASLLGDNKAHLLAAYIYSLTQGKEQVAAK